MRNLQAVSLLVLCFLVAGLLAGCQGYMDTAKAVGGAAYHIKAYAAAYAAAENDK